MNEPLSIGTIMVVDDKPSNLQLLGRILKEKGYQVRIFPKGDLAVKSAISDPPDLILLDITMPGLDGYEVCRLLKENSSTRDLPVVFISALSETSDKIKAFQSGGVDFITKPFQVEEVHARVEIHLTLKRIKAALEEKNRVLEQALDELKTAQQFLVQSEKMAALGVLVAGIAHEINNPVNFIKASAVGLDHDIKDLHRLLSMHDHCEKTCTVHQCRDPLLQLKQEIDYSVLVKEIPDMVSNIMEGVRRTEEIVDSLRVYSRMDSAARETSDVHNLINSALAILKNRYHNKVVILREFQTLPFISVHPAKMIQVFINVISNALDALDSFDGTSNGESPRITIRTCPFTRNGIRFAMIQITDNGPGIPDSIVSQIFDPFFTTKDVGKGTGLGLSISYGIIKEHQGSIEFTNEATKGATFSILLPLAEEDV